MEDKQLLVKFILKHGRFLANLVLAESQC